MSQEDIVRGALDRLTARAPRPLHGSAPQAGWDGASGAALDAATDLASAGPAPMAAPAQDWLEGVAGVGLGEKETCGRIGEAIALKVYVERKLPRRMLDAPVPPTLALPGMPPITTDVVEIGRVELQSNTQRIRPAIPGYSIGRALDTKEAGTFGMLVRRTGQASPTYLLSNSHAIAASGFATRGDVIIQPGGADGGSAPGDAIGTLADWVPLVYGGTGFDNTVDAAIAEMTDGDASAAIALLGTPKGINTALKRGDYVQKVGRTTALSIGRVMDVDLRLPSTYPDATGTLQRVGFSDQVLVTFYSAPGDSGSPVLDMDGNVVGLHVCGSPVIGVFCKIANVMAQLDIEVVTSADGAAS